MQGLVLLQEAIRKRLVATTAVTQLVPAENIIDYDGLPTKFPCIILGDDQAVNADPVISPHEFVVDLYANVHVWARGGGMVECKKIAAEVHAALFDKITLEENGRPRMLVMEQVRFLRDPDGETSHGVLTFKMFWTEAAQ